MSGNVAEVIALVVGLVVQDSNECSVYIMSPLEILWLNMITSYLHPLVHRLKCLRHYPMLQEISSERSWGVATFGKEPKVE